MIKLDAMGNLKTYFYDIVGNMIIVQNAKSFRINYEYGSMCNMTRQYRS